MKIQSTDKILITGAGGGFGRELVLAFKKFGAKLILTDNNITLLKKLFDEVDLNEDLLGYEICDLSNAKEIEKFIFNTKDKYGNPDILVNNAGIASIGRFLDIPQKNFELILNVNLLAPMRLTYGFLPKMVEKKRGGIINIVSVAGLISSPNLAAYSASKFGIKSFGESINREYSGMGIQVTNLYPFFTKTPILESERFGISEEFQIPEVFLSNPKEVIEELMERFMKDDLHVYPGIMSKSSNFIGKFFPEVFDIMSKYFKR
jgi:short-subunit dehydrogenase